MTILNSLMATSPQKQAVADEVKINTSSTSSAGVSDSEEEEKTESLKPFK